MSVSLPTELNLPSLDDASCVVMGAVSRDLFDNVEAYPTRTYAYGGHFWTGVEAFDAVEVCSAACLDDWHRSSDPMGGAHFPVRLTIDVEHNREGWEVPCFLQPGDPSDGAGAGDAVAYPFRVEDHEAYDWPITCNMCGRLMVPGPTGNRFIRDAFAQYAETLIWQGQDWSAVDDVEVHNPEPLDKRFSASDLDTDQLVELSADLIDFVCANWRDVSDLDAEQVGHDFCLTRNGHGAGFWDRGLGEVGTRLTEACKPYGSLDLDVDDEGNLYVPSVDRYDESVPHRDGQRTLVVRSDE